MTSAVEQYVYLVSYFYIPHGGGFGFGSAKVNLDGPMTHDLLMRTTEDIRTSNGYAGVTALNFQLYSGPADQA